MRQIILILCLFVFSGITIHACSISPYNPSRDFRQAKAVFIGKVIDVAVDDRKLTGTQRYNVLYKVRFSVEKSWKGKTSEITAISDNGQEPCGSFNFQVGEQYLVYAYPFGERLAAWASVASPTRPLKPEDKIPEMRINQLNSFWFRWKADLWYF